MNQRTALQPHEIRVIKINRKTILELLGEIFKEISFEKFRLPQNKYYRKKICVEWFFDEKQCEITLLAYSRASGINSETIITLVNPLSFEAIDSLLSKDGDEEYYYSLYRNSFYDGNPTLIRQKENEMKSNRLGKLFDNVSIGVRPLKKCEIRVIRISQQAINELLWEHFMETGDEVMEISEEDGGISTIYHMYTEGELEELTLYVMNLNEASDEVFIRNKAFCNQNIHFTTDSYFKKSTQDPKYVSAILL